LVVRKTRKAYTLFELIMVLAIILVISALAYPSLTSSQSQTKGTASADSVKAAWTSARAQAMKENRPYRFAVVWNKGNYRVAPDSDEFWSGSAPAASDPASAPLIIDEALPEGVIFRSPDQGGSDSAPSQTALPPDAISQDMWASVVVFNPDGSASEDKEITFQAPGSSGTTLKLRAFTGTSSAQ